MPEQERLRFCVLTPRAAAVDRPVDGARVPTETGQVGLRPRGEPLLLAVEAGLVVLRDADGIALVATAGGLLESDGVTATLYTPFAATGATAEEVEAALDAALADPESELAARQRLEELEQHILQELGHGPPAAPGGHHGG